MTYKPSGMLHIARRKHHALVQLVILGLLFQSYLAVLPAQAMFFAATHHDEIASDYAIICTGTGLRRISLNSGTISDEQRDRPIADIECHICLAMSACALALPGTAKLPPADLHEHAAPQADEQQIFRDHRGAIRPGHDPPSAL